jgi:glucose-6-phosphate isomerase
MSAYHTMKCTEVPQYDALQNAAAEFQYDDKLHLRNLCNDSSRCAGLTAVHMSEGFRKIILDYSRQQVTGETMEMLFDLADAVGFTERREAFRSGERINTTEDKAVLHHILRMPKGFYFSGSVHSLTDKILEEIHGVRDQVASFSEQVRNGSRLGITGKQLINTVVVTCGGMHLGTEFVHDALSADESAAEAAEGRILHFLSNVDPVDTFLTTQNLDPAETLVVIVAKDFNSGETLNARSAMNWLIQHLTKPGVVSDSQVIEKHVVAVTCMDNNFSKSAPAQLGIPKYNVFRIWDWVIGRYSVCSAAGLLPLSLQYSYPIMSEFLDGAHDMDEHFFNAPLRDNIPVLLGLLGVWNSTFMGYSTRAILPYAEALRRFGAHVQLVDMESNGKRVALDGVELLHPSGEINFGAPGTNSHHSFFQLMHQGRVVPADFIGFMESQRPLDLPGENVPSHDELMSNFFAQPDALAYGKTLVDLMQEGVADGLREHMVFTGNRPSSSILMTRLDPFSVGQLLALYEHRTAVQGFLWGINSFDQYGLELGKLLAKHVRVQLAASRRTGATVQGFNLSTSTLLEAYLAHGKQQNPG